MKKMISFCRFLSLITFIIAFVIGWHTENVRILILSNIFIVWVIIFDLMYFKLMYLDIENQKLKLLTNIMKAFDKIKKKK